MDHLRFARTRRLPLATSCPDHAATTSQATRAACAPSAGRPWWDTPGTCKAKIFAGVSFIRFCACARDPGNRRYAEEVLSVSCPWCDDGC